MGVAATDPIDLITQSMFTMSMFARGYDCREVDEFLDSLVAHLRLGAAADVVDELIRDAAFTESRGGYRVAEVDDFLDQVVATVRRGVAVEAGPVATDSRGQDLRTHVITTSSSSASALIAPRKGLLARILGQ